MIQPQIRLELILTVSARPSRQQVKKMIIRKARPDDYQKIAETHFLSSVAADRGFFPAFRKHPIKVFSHQTIGY